MGWLSETMEKASGLIDKAQGYAASAVVRVAEPKVKEEIDTRVVVFRDEALQALPQQCEEKLRSKADTGSPVAWVFHQVLGDNTDQLVELLVNFFRSGINDATAGLSGSATQKIMEQLKDLLDGAEAEAASSSAAAQGPAGGEQVAAQVEQLQVAEAPGQRSRGLELPAAGGGEPAGAGGEGGFRGLTLSNVAALAGMAFSVEQHVPDFELRARELVHPLFEELKVKVWELVPAALQDALGPLIGEKQGQVEANPEVRLRRPHIRFCLFSRSVGLGTSMLQSTH
ncbi:hypothetical protein COO60DRAFT_1551454, partial [Scenedesmus sp. NREL 46B-D3]